MNYTNSHLSEDDLDEVLMGCASDEASAHMDACAVCQQKVADFSTSMGVFNQATTDWAEARSNTLLPPTTRRGFRWIPAPQWQAAGALALVVSIAAGTQISRMIAPEPVSAPTSAAFVHDVHNPVEIESDNAMLAAIDSEVGATSQPARFGLLQETTAHVEPAHRDTNPQDRD